MDIIKKNAGWFCASIISGFILLSLWHSVNAVSPYAITAWECTENASGTACIVTATTSIEYPFSTSTGTTSGGYDGPNLQEWLFVAGVLLFMISFSFWPKISFTNINKKVL